MVFRTQVAAEINGCNSAWFVKTGKKDDTIIRIFPIFATAFFVLDLADGMIVKPANYSSWRCTPADRQIQIDLLCRIPWKMINSHLVQWHILRFI